MARRRCQNPKPRKEGRLWVLYYWADEFINGERRRKRKRQPLAPATMPEREVRKVALDFLRPLNQGLAAIGSATNFNDFVDGTYIPVVLEAMAKSTRDRSLGVIEKYLKPRFGGLCLRDITVLTSDKYMVELGKLDLEFEAQDKVRDVVSSIMGSAVRYGLIMKNPFEGVRPLRPKRAKRVKRWITEEVFCRLLHLIVEPYATMIFVAVYTGLRVSELIGLRWRNVHGDKNQITVEERYCRGDWGAPKSEASSATIEVNRAVIERIQQLKSLTVSVRAGRAIRRYPIVKSSGPDDLVFQSVMKGVPMRDNNILVRHIKPAGRKLGIDWVNWQVLRRSFSMLLKKNGADIKDAQALMRHSNASTTMNVYMQFDTESQRRVVDGLVH